MPRSRQARPTSATGCTTPVSLFASIMATSFVSGRIAAMTASAGTTPLRSGGTTVTAWPRRSSSWIGSDTLGCSIAVVTTCARAAPKIAALLLSVPPLVNTTSRAAARDVVFTSGGTESNNAAIFGAARAHVVTTAIEHPSVSEPIQELERRGHAVTVVPPLRSGVVPAEAVIAAIRPETKLVAMMLANNETGVVQPVAEVGRACRESGIHLHCDAVQAAGKIDIDVKALGVDTLSLSAHKLHAPKGIGAMYVRGGLSLDRYLFGGAQERRRRAGTENVPLAVAFGVAAELARDAA